MGNLIEKIKNLFRCKKKPAQPTSTPPRADVPLEQKPDQPQADKVEGKPEEQKEV